MLQLFEGDGGAIDAARAPQLSFLATPGHTPGHIVVCVTPAGEAVPRAVYVGDALHVRCTCTARSARSACTAHIVSRTRRAWSHAHNTPHTVTTLRAGQIPAQVERPDWSPHFDCCCWAGKFAAKAWSEGMSRSAAEGGGSWGATTSVEQVTLTLATRIRIPSPSHNPSLSPSPSPDPNPGLSPQPHSRSYPSLTPQAQPRPQPRPQPLRRRSGGGCSSSLRRTGRCCSRRTSLPPGWARSAGRRRRSSRPKRAAAAAAAAAAAEAEVPVVAVVAAGA